MTVGRCQVHFEINLTVANYVLQHCIDIKLCYFKLHLSTVWLYLRESSLSEAALGIFNFHKPEKQLITCSSTVCMFTKALSGNYIGALKQLPECDIIPAFRTFIYFYSIFVSI